MKKSILFVCTTLLSFSVLFAQSIDLTLYEILDAQDANKFYEEMGGSGWQSNSNWPMPTDRTQSLTTPYGVTFKRIDTIQLNDTTRLIQVKVKKLKLSSNRLSGEIPDASLGELDSLYLGFNAITAVSQNAHFPSLKLLDLSFNDIDSWNDLALPQLLRLDLRDNELSGSLDQFNASNLEYLDVSYNDLTGVSGNLNYPQLREFNLYYNDITGAVPDWDLPSLEVLRLGSNEFSGSLHDFSGMPNLKEFYAELNELSGELPLFAFQGNIEHLNLIWNDLSGPLPAYAFSNLQVLALNGNKLSGTIPPLEMPAVRQVGLGDNDFSGEIPAFIAPNLEILGLNDNELTGSIQNISYPQLQTLYLDGNNLTGEIPLFSSPELRSIHVSFNQLSGELPALDLPNLQIFYAYGNQLTGGIPAFNCPELTNLEIDNNMLSGEIQSFHLPKICTLNVAFNMFEGAFPDEALPDLKSLKILGNKFEDMPNITSTSPQLYELFCARNRFEFDDLEPFVSLDYFVYWAQDSVDMIPTKMGNQTELKVDVGGSQNVYAWYEDGTLIPGETSDKITIDSVQDPKDFKCDITSTLVPDLTLHSRLVEPKGPRCWENDYFKICMSDEDEGWASGDSQHEIVSAHPLTVNDFLHFEGNITVDTVQLKIKIDGKFLLKEIPLPGGGSGDFKLVEGEYDLALAGGEGKITGFLNNTLGQYVPNIGGLEIKIEDLGLIGGKAATGVSLSFSVSFNNITPSCGSSSSQTTSIKIEGLALSSAGVSVDGLQVADLGLAPGFCLKGLSAGYNQDMDKLTFGLSLLTPFIEVGGGLGFIAGQIDSIAMKAVLQNSIIPIASTGIGIIGCEGRINSITNPPWNMRFGGIFSSVLSDDLFQLTTSVEYIPPAELKIEAGDGKFFNPPFYDDWWQVEGGIYGSIDFRDYKMKTGGNVKLVPYKDGNDKKFMASGKLDLTYRKQKYSTFLGNFDGMVTIPKLSTRFPFDWLTAKLGLPHTVSGNGLMLYKPTNKFIVGDVNLGGRIGDVQYRIEMSKPYDDPDFFSFRVKEGSITNGFGRTFEYTFDVPEAVNLAVFKAFNQVALADVSLVMPDGTIISENQPSANAELDKLAPQKKTFWTLYDPAPGSWKARSDVELITKVYYFQEGSDFQIDASWQNDSIRLWWDPLLFSNGDSLDLFVDENKQDYNGAYLSTVDAMDGIFIIPASLLDGFCSFYLHALAFREDDLLTAYADQEFLNMDAGFDLPEDIVVSFNPQSLELMASWTPSTDPFIAGYVISLLEDSTSRVIGMPYGDESSFTYQLDEYKGQRIQIQSYGVDGEVSCASREYDLLSGVKPTVHSGSIDLLVYPNPFRHSCTLKFTSDKKRTGNLLLFNAQGTLVNGPQFVELQTGVNEIGLEMQNHIPGIYHLIFYSDQLVLRTSVIVL